MLTKIYLLFIFIIVQLLRDTHLTVRYSQFILCEFLYRVKFTSALMRSHYVPVMVNPWIMYFFIAGVHVCVIESLHSHFNVPFQILSKHPDMFCPALPSAGGGLLQHPVTIQPLLCTQRGPIFSKGKDNTLFISIRAMTNPAAMEVNFLYFHLLKGH